jgi:sugar lactone lactonase YvrE
MPQLSHFVQLGVIDDRTSGVLGLASVDNRRLFVLQRSGNEQRIEVYDKTTFKLQQTLNVAGLKHDWKNGLAACASSNCLFVSDWKGRSVFKLRLSDHNEVFKWRIDGDPAGLSINATCNVLVACHEARKLLEYTPSGSLVREISLQLKNVELHPCHAIQLTSDQFVVTLLTFPIFDSSVHDDVVEVNSLGQVVVSYDNQLQTATGRKFSMPHNIAVDENKRYIFVNDGMNRRVVMLSRSSNRAYAFSASTDGSESRGPFCVCLNDDSLYVGESDGRVLMFDVRCQ